MPVGSSATAAERNATALSGAIALRDGKVLGIAAVCADLENAGHPTRPPLF